ncbi:dynein heavy chain, putative [Trypanosoma cruzi marinkellei]|uniref:Dynein heavy chain, putative n=1 Tax=Trypanosoma cruzi marinkellei TaxID=85056 RepID=K2NEK7_TRYCR|nr:dynein heavy chain, putative [Trypanosoma cruzi marinkellei]
MEQQVIAVHYQRMEEWLSDRKAVLGKKHKKEFFRLMELAPKLEQLVRYEIPAQHKQNKRLSSLLDDAYGSIEDATKARKNLEERQKRFFQEYGFVESQGAEEEELEAVIEAKISSSTTFLNEALREFGRSPHLESFRAAYVRAASMYSVGMYDDNVFSLHLPWLDRVYQERFCKSMVDINHNEHHQKQQAGERDQIAAGASTGPCNIDWGDGNTLDAVDVGETVEIKWDEEALEVAVEDAVRNCRENNKKMDDGCVEKPTDTVEGIFTIDVSNAAHRKNILTDLQAFACFASERSSMDDESLAEPAAAVEVLVKKLTASTEAAFVRMKTIPTLRFSFMEEVRRLQRGIAAASMRKSNSQARVHQIQEELERLGPQLDALLNAARNCRDECLAELSKMFPGRTVSIVGDINKYL